MLGFLVEVLEKGPTSTQAPILTIIHCLLHYVDMTTGEYILESVSDKKSFLTATDSMKVLSARGRNSEVVKVIL